MKFIASADWHIRDYRQHNLSENFRLNQYLVLAKQMKETALANDVKNFILAGDVFDRYFIEGKDIHYFYAACEILLEIQDAKIYITHGNHEVDAKNSYSSTDTVLPEICTKHKSGRIFYKDNELVDIDGCKFYFMGWRPKFELPDVEADILVGHEYVSGAILPNGISTDNDNKISGSKIKYAIMGDIHKSQIVQNGKVLIPGAPIQNSLKDSPNSVYQLVSFDNGIMTSEAIEVKDILHFYYEDEFEKLGREPTPLDIIKKRNLSNLEKESSIDTSKLFDIKEISENLLSKYEFGKEILSKLKSFEASSSSNDLKVKLQKIHISNFKSIDNLDLDFNDLKKLTILRGPIGSGKTSILQAIIWNLSGYCYKDKSDMISTGAKTCTVQMTLMYDNHLFDISRSYGSEKDLIIYIDEKPLDANTITARQEKLEQALPIINKLNLLYFDQGRDGLLNELSDSSRVGLISELAGLSCVDNLTEEMSEALELVKSEALEDKNISIPLNCN